MRRTGHYQSNPVTLQTNQTNNDNIQLHVIEE